MQEDKKDLPRLLKQSYSSKKEETRKCKKITVELKKGTIIQVELSNKCHHQHHKYRFHNNDIIVVPLKNTIWYM